MFNGSEEDRKAILQAGEILGETTKWFFVSIMYLGASLAISIKVGNKAIKIIKGNIQNLKRKEGELEL